MIAPEGDVFPVGEDCVAPVGLVARSGDDRPDELLPPRAFEDVPCPLDICCECPERVRGALPDNRLSGEVENNFGSVRVNHFSDEPGPGDITFDPDDPVPHPMQY